MNTEYFIAKRLAVSKDTGNRLSRLMSIVSIVSIALGLAVMISTVAIVTGFRSEITGKLVGGSAHLQITNLDSNSSFETNPINADQNFLPELQALKGVKHVQKYITKGGIIKTEQDVQGVVLKGVGNDFDWSFFSSCIVEGEVFSVSDTATINSIIISKSLAQRLRLKLGDKFEVYFVQEPLRIRKFTIVGMYTTQLDEIDKSLVLCDMKHLQKIYGWQQDQISGFEVIVDDINKINEIGSDVAGLVVCNTYDDGSRLTVSNVIQLYPNLFVWLEMLNTNVWIILILTIAVAGFNMISGLLIMLLERTSMIGILKSLGMQSVNIRKLFLYRSAFIVIKGMIIGNIIGIGCCLAQKYFGIVKLDPSNYFVAIVPINLNLWHVVLINILSLAVIILVLIIPSRIITTISPEKTIRFE